MVRLPYGVYLPRIRSNGANLKCSTFEAGHGKVVNVGREPALNCSSHGLPRGLLLARNFLMLLIVLALSNHSCPGQLPGATTFH